MKKQFVKAISALFAASLIVTAVPLQAQAAVGTVITQNQKKASKVVVVTTQAELKKALKDPNVTEIKIKTDEAVDFKIPAGDYAGKAVVVNAPNARIVNKGGVFEKVAIRGEKSGTWKECGEGNTFVVTAQDAKIVVAKNASVEKIALKSEGSQAVINVKGTVETVKVTADVSVSIVGTAETTNVVVSKNAEGASITASVPVQITAKADVKVELKEGAENSSVTTASSEVKAEIKNDTAADVTVTTPDGSGTVEAGKENTTDTVVPPSADKNEGDTNSGSNSGNSGGGSGNSNSNSNGSIVGPGNSNNGNTGNDNNNEEKPSETPGEENPDDSTTTPPGEENPTITGVYENGNTVYTLTGADSFKDLKSVTVALGFNGAGKELSLTIDNQLTAWYDILTNSTTAVERWKNITNTTYTTDDYTMTISGTEETAEKTLVVTQSGKEYQATVTMTQGTDDAISVKLTVTQPSNVEETTITFKVTDTTITIVGQDATSSESGCYMNFSDFTK